MAARREPTWADIPAMAPPPLGTEREVPALAAVVSLLGKLSAEERGRVMRYALDKFAPQVRFGEPEDGGS